MTVVIGEDTDVLVLSCHQADILTKDFTTDNMVGGTNIQSFFDIHLLQRALCSEVWRLLPFAPTMTGCDIRLRLFGIAKAPGTRVG